MPSPQVRQVRVINNTKIRVAVPTKGKEGVEVDATVVGPFAIHLGLEGTAQDGKWCISHIKTGYRLPATLSNENQGINLAELILIQNPNLCWNFGSFDYYNYNDDADLSEYSLAVKKARTTLGLGV